MVMMSTKAVVKFMVPGSVDHSLNIMRGSNTVRLCFIDYITPTVFDHLLILKEWFLVIKNKRSHGDIGE